MDIKESPSWFVVISYEILTSKELTDKEKLLMGLISSLQGERGYCYANNKYLSDCLNCSPDTVKDLISNLVNLKWLHRKVYRNEKNEFVKRILTVKMSKKVNEFDENIEKDPPCKIPPTPPFEIPPTSVEKTPLLIYNINKEDIVLGETEKTKNLPTLEGIIEISNKIFKERIWVEQICISTSTKIPDMVKWMRAFNLHISNSEDIENITDRKYKHLFVGWLRAKKASGVKLSDFTLDNSQGQQKQALAPPLTRL